MDSEEDLGWKKHYRILSEETMRQLQENDISQVCNALSVSRATACTLLLRNRWCVSSVLAGGGAVCTKQEKTNYCKICMETVDISSMLSADSCGHPFCSDCWKGYVAVSINEGPECLMLRCPEAECEGVAGLDVVEAVASGDEKHKWYRYLGRSYVEWSRMRKWCPGPGCDLAVELLGGGECYEVTCDCRHEFCWSCMEERHSPVDCRTVARWIEDDSSEARNNAWIQAHTRRCPQCKRTVEVDLELHCMIVMCNRPCGFQFCRRCLSGYPFAGHGCKGVEEGEASAVDWERFEHYYNRWCSNHQQRGLDLAYVALVRDEVQDKWETEFKFVKEAWDQIIECRRVLKWSYVSAYYMERERKRKRALIFLDYLQGGAQAALHRLHSCAEKETEDCIKPDCPWGDFCNFRVKLADLTSLTKNYCHNLVTAVEDETYYHNLDLENHLP